MNDTADFSFSRRGPKMVRRYQISILFHLYITVRNFDPEFTGPNPTSTGNKLLVIPLLLI